MMLYRPPAIETGHKSQKTDIAWLRAALVFGTTMSKDPETKVGACIVSQDNMRASFGYNGFPMGVPDTDENWANKELKNSLCQHAEFNALAKAPFDVSGAICYVTLKPCHRCLGALVNAQIDRVVWLMDEGRTAESHWKYFDPIAFELIRSSSGIGCLGYEKTDVEQTIIQVILGGK